MRHLEYKHQGTSLGRAFDRLCNALTLDPRWIVPLFAWQWGFGEDRKGSRVYGPWGDWESQYRNGRIFIGLSLPFGVWIMWRPLAFGGKWFLQTSLLPNLIFLALAIHAGLWWHWLPIPFTSWWWLLVFLPGWKRIGRPAYHLRVQTDASAQGGLAVGFEDGPK